MHIAVNVRHYLRGRIGGQENYLHAILRGLVRRGQKLTIFAQPSEMAAVRAMVGAEAEIRAVPEEGRPMFQAVAGGGFDLLFCPLHALEPLDPRMPSAVMIPDLQHEFFPHYFDDRERQRRCRNYEPSARKASVVLTCSEFTKRTLVDRYEVPAEKVVVCGHGVDDAFLANRADSEPPDLPELPADFLYFPAFYWPHKNHENALKALKLVHDHGDSNLHLVCSGGEGPERDRVQRLVDDLGLNARVMLLGRVESSAVPELYRRSRGLLFPTLFEGFGIPVLEALSLGVPVITSQGGAAEEVAGGCAVLVEPEDPASIAVGVETVLADSALRERLTAEGRKRAALFSWDQAVETTLAAFRRVTEAGYQAPAQVEVKEWPVISVALLGGEEELAAAVASVRAQEYPHVEWHLARKGPAYAVDSSGALLNVLRPGDEWLPGAASAVARAWRRAPRAGVIYGLAKRGADVEGMVPYFYEDLNYGPVWAPPAAFYGRSALEAVGGLPGEQDLLAELELRLRVAAGHPVVGLAECLVVWGCAREGEAELERVHAGAIALIQGQFDYVSPAWIDGRAVRRLAGLQGAMSGRWGSLPRGLVVNRGRRQRYWRDWRQDGSSE
ncbi:MAG: glycosyltransferase family 1 protein [Paludibaculum sp.]